MALALLLFACSAREPVAPPVILISIDTLRSDRLPAYGYRAVATPNLDAFRRDAILFERAYSHSPLTLPSHATILTGVLPSVHGVRDNVGFRVKPVERLPSQLKARGYTTAAAVSAYVLRRATGIAEGFDVYDDEIDRAARDQSLGAVQRAGTKTIEIARRWISQNGARPFFYFLHLYEPHAPYEAPEPYRSRYANAYDAEVAYSDALLGELFSFLRGSDLYDRALIIILSDHGEGLGDHGEDEHGIFLYREAIQVPLLVKLPSGTLAGTTVKTAVGLQEIAPMILRALDDPRSVVDVKPRPVYSETWYPRFHFGWSDLHSLIDGGEHFIDAPRAELYDLGSDPAEKNNLLAERRRRAAALRALMAPLKSEAEAPAAVDAEEMQKLAALGYIGSGTMSRGGPLPDPKDRTTVFRDLREAFRLQREGRDAEALARFDRILENDPDLIDAWDVRSKVLFRMGRTADSIASAKEALRRSPSSTHLAIDLANALLIAGDAEEARRHAELALKSDPSRAHEILARIALLHGDVVLAESEARMAVDAPGETNAALYTLARVEQKKGRPEEVIRLTGELLARLARTGGRPLRGLHALRADALARSGDSAAAERAFREELRLFPGDAEAYRGLIVLLASEGRTEEATRLIRELAAASPNRQTYELIAQTLEVLGDREGARYWRGRVRGSREPPKAAKDL
ncbi:MAG TPA: sulfatase-like hydrolase/transferase [Thermoanaerobaculia bacterium]|nr:sulfatase-like hydrolase/transferase [Thermoanaerobaculia bacterium]